MSDRYMLCRRTRHFEYYDNPLQSIIGIYKTESEALQVLHQMRTDTHFDASGVRHVPRDPSDSPYVGGSTVYDCLFVEKVEWT